MGNILHELPGDFDRHRKLNVRDLNRIKDATGRELLGDGQVNVTTFGNRRLLSGPNRIIAYNKEVRFFRVDEEFDDILICTPLAYGPDPEPHSPTGVNPDVKQVIVAKPRILQKTPYDGETVVALGENFTYTYTDIGKRTTVGSVRGSYPEEIYPAYFSGDIIAATRTSTGLTNYDTPAFDGQVVSPTQFFIVNIQDLGLIQVGERVTLTWEGGVRYNSLVMSISEGRVVVFEGGTGDPLPAINTAITIQTEEPIEWEDINEGGRTWNSALSGIGVHSADLSIPDFRSAEVGVLNVIMDEATGIKSRPSGVLFPLHEVTVSLYPADGSQMGAVDTSTYQRLGKGTKEIDELAVYRGYVGGLLPVIGDHYAGPNLGAYVSFGGFSAYLSPVISDLMASGSVVLVEGVGTSIIKYTTQGADYVPNIFYNPDGTLADPPESALSYVELELFGDATDLATTPYFSIFKYNTKYYGCYCTRSDGMEIVGGIVTKPGNPASGSSPPPGAFTGSLGS